MNDFDYQMEFVVDAAWRLLALQNDNPASPTYGCLHYGYWRDKTSEFPDARFQEAGAVFALLALPQYDSYRSQGRLPDSEILYEAFTAALKNWSRQQYPEGCFDEWYKGERGFAATEFTMIAFGLAGWLAGDSMQDQEKETLSRTMTRAAHWLSGRTDTVKSNHEAAAAAALALAWKVTGEERFLKAARMKWKSTLGCQTAEGWFPEIGGVDLGYCSVLLDFTMLYATVAEDESVIPSMQRLLSFMVPHIHPDLTISAEAGLCLNPFVSRLGMGLLSPHDETAAAFVSAAQSRSPEEQGLQPYLADDLRLVRWSYLPLVTDILRHRFRSDDLLEDHFPGGWTIHPEAGLAAYHDGHRHLYLCGAGGGAVFLYRDTEPVFQDRGVSITDGERTLVCQGHDPSRHLTELPEGLRIDATLSEISFVSPGFWSRLVLRIGCIWPLTSRLLRNFIDHYRLKNRTAINQSAASVANSGSPISLERQVLVSVDQVQVIDSLSSSGEPIDLETVGLQLRLNGKPHPKLHPSLSGRSRSVSIVKACDDKKPQAKISISVKKIDG